MSDDLLLNKDENLNENESKFTIHINGKYDGEKIVQINLKYMGLVILTDFISDVVSYFRKPWTEFYTKDFNKLRPEKFNNWPQMRVEVNLNDFGLIF